MQASELEALGYESVRLLASGEYAGLMSFLYTTGLCVGLEQAGYRTRFCFPDQASAIQALNHWDGHGDPPGPWLKQKGEIERDNPRREANHFRGVPIIAL